MKKQSTRLIALFAFAFFLSACKKDNTGNTGEARLMSAAITSVNGTGDMVIDYNNQGKITKVSWRDNNGVLTTLWNVSYSGSEIIMAIPEVNSAEATIKDTIRFTIDNNNRVQRRIQQAVTEYKSPASYPQISFTRDTTVYEYDATGLITKGIRGYWDSTWFYPPGNLQIYAERKTGVDTYTNTNGNVMAINSSLDLRATSYQGTSPSTFKGNETIINTFEYTKGYKNKADFSNAAVMNELSLLSSAPVNKNYVNLPDKLSYFYTMKDGNGTVMRTDSSTNSFTLDYNSDGFLDLYMESAIPNAKKIFTYSK